MNKLEKLIKEFKLEPLIGEGGMWARAYKTDEIIKSGFIRNVDKDYPLYSSIYYVMTEKSFSHMHVLKTDELWFYHEGQSVEMLFVNPDYGSKTVVLGPDIEKGERPQILCKKGTYQGAHMFGKGEYALVSCINVPAYLDEDYQIGEYEQLKKHLSQPDHDQLLRKLTGEIEF